MQLFIILCYDNVRNVRSPEIRFLKTIDYDRKNRGKSAGTPKHETISSTVSKRSSDLLYFPIIENAYNRQMLLQLGNIVSTLFLLEAHYEANLLQRVLLALYEKSHDRQAVSLFLNFVLQLYLHGRIDESDYKKLERTYQDRQEVSMLIEAIQKEKTNLRESGKREGKREGRLEVARMMLRSGESIEKIKRYTGLSDESIRKLQQKLQE